MPKLPLRLEKALENKDENEITLSIRKIILMQAQSFYIGGVPMLFYGDETGYTNDYTYLQDPSKSYDNRWMHRPVIDWKKNERIEVEDTVEERIFSATQRLIRLRKKLAVVADLKNLTWLTPHNIHVAGFLRAYDDDKLYGLFNYSNKAAYITWYTFKEHGFIPKELYDHWTEKTYSVGPDHAYFVLEPYAFALLEAIK